MSKVVLNLKVIALGTAMLMPMAAFAHPNRASSAHMRPNLFRVRVSQSHNNVSTPHR